MTDLAEIPTAELEDQAHAALMELERRRVIHLKPHRVHQKAAIVTLDTETVTTPAQDDDPRPKGTKVTGSRYAGALSCPDCTRGLVGFGIGMGCSQLPPGVSTQPCHKGCIVACGEGK